MGPAKDKKEKPIKAIVEIALLLIAVVVFVIMVSKLFNGKTVYTSAGSENMSTASLSCKTDSKDISNAFFDVSNAALATQEIKIIFKNEKINDISYSATINYADDIIAKTKEADFSNKYGLFMSKNGKNINYFSPNFSANDGEVKISLFASIGQLSNELSRVFLIGEDDTTLLNRDPETIFEIYANKGFKCKLGK